jgi:hypothetical protein
LVANTCRRLYSPLKEFWSIGDELYCQTVWKLQPTGSVPTDDEYRATHSGLVVPKLEPTHWFHQLVDV